MNELPRIEGISVQINGSVQEAIKRADTSYKAKYGRPATHVSLPGWIMPDALELWTMHLGRPTSQGKTRTKHPGTVICGHPIGGNGAGQLELFGV